MLWTSQEPNTSNQFWCFILLWALQELRISFCYEFCKNQAIPSQCVLRFNLGNFVVQSFKSLWCFYSMLCFASNLLLCCLCCCCSMNWKGRALVLCFVVWKISSRFIKHQLRFFFQWIKRHQLCPIDGWIGKHQHWEALI